MLGLRNGVSLVKFLRNAALVRGSPGWLIPAPPAPFADPARRQVFFSDPTSETVSFALPGSTARARRLPGDQEFPSLVELVVGQNSPDLMLYTGIARAFNELLAALRLADPPTAPTSLWNSTLLAALMSDGPGAFAAWESEIRRRRNTPSFYEDIAASLQLVRDAVRHCRLVPEPTLDTLVFIPILCRFTECVFGSARNSAGTL